MKNKKQILVKAADKSCTVAMKAFIEQKNEENKVLEKLLAKIKENQSKKQKATS